jgi:hypothetical protein
MENQSTAKKTRFGVPMVRGIIVVVASCGFIAFLSRVLSGGDPSVGLLFFVAGTLALGLLTPPPDTLPAIGEEGANKSSQRRTPWSLVTLCVIIGAGYNWTWIFFAFEQRYAFFSAPVVGAMGVIMAFYALVAFLVGRLTGGNWRMVLMVFAAASCCLGAIVLRLIKW